MVSDLRFPQLGHARQGLCVRAHNYFLSSELGKYNLRREVKAAVSDLGFRNCVKIHDTLNPTPSLATSTRKP